MSGARPFNAGLPLAVVPAAPLRTAAARLAWYREQRPRLEQLAAAHGAIVLRDVGIDSTAEFGAFAACHHEHLQRYVAGAAPRARIAGNVYQSTRIPPAFRIGLHQEKAYMPVFPRRLIFHCRQPASRGGETLLCDMRALTRQLPESLKQTFKTRGVRYSRNFRDASHSDSLVQRLFGEYHRVWQEAFDAEDRATVERRCRELDLVWQWCDDGSITVSNVCAAFQRDPLTGEDLWFNQATAQHVNPQALGATSYTLLTRCYAKRPAPPYAVHFGDGGAIAMEQLQPVYELLERLSVSWAWQVGDYLLIDNLRAAHGRNSYHGERDVQVALCD